MADFNVLLPDVDEQLYNKTVKSVKLWKGGIMAIRSQDRLQWETPSWVALGCFIPGVGPWIGSRNCARWSGVGVQKRLMNDAVGELGHEAKQTVRKFVRQLIHETGITPLEDVDIPSLEQWLADQYPGERASQIRESRPDWTREQAADALDRYEQKGEIVEGLEEFVTLKSFPKDEGYLEPKVPRNINPRGDPYLKCMGPVIHACEKRIIRDMGQFIGLVKNMDMPERARYTRMRLGECGPYVSADFSCFEGSIRGSMLEYIELTVLRHLTSRLSDKHAVSVLLGLDSKTVLCIQRTVWYYVKCRMSGDLWTSIGNGLANFAVTTLAWTRSAQRVDSAWTPLRMARSLMGVYEGDDSLVCQPVGVPVPGPDDFSFFGMSAKIELADTLEEALFCQLAWMDDGNLGDIRRFVRKFFFTNARQKWDPRQWDGLLRAKATSLAYLFPKCPILSALAGRVLRETRGVQEVWDLDWYHRHLEGEVKKYGLHMGVPSMKVRAFVARTQGISVDEQLRTEHYLAHTWKWRQDLDPEYFTFAQGNAATVIHWPRGTPMRVVTRMPVQTIYSSARMPAEMELRGRTEVYYCGVGTLRERLSELTGKLHPQVGSGLLFFETNDVGRRRRKLVHKGSGGP